jgi:hypothetical protein
VKCLPPILALVSIGVSVLSPLEAGARDGVITHPIPDPLVDVNGRRISTAAQWVETHRAQLLATFEREIYGVTPPMTLQMDAEVWDDAIINDSRTRRKQVRLTFRSEYGSATAELLIYAPTGGTGPVPVFLGLNSGGNLTITHDPDVPGQGRRGRHERRWPVEFVTGAGYAVATLGCDDFFPDKDMASYAGSMQRLFPPETRGPGPDRWGAIATWAWGLSRALDYLTGDPQFDAERVAVIGHSRLGKAALWAGARDDRFALVISNNSGCGGAALSKRLAGETVAAINLRFPYWFCQNFGRYNHREELLPVDQHQLLALVAPRALAVASAEEDSWADPVGERLALELAQPVFALFGVPPLAASAEDMGRRRLHYHLRPGEHDILLADWEEYVRFADEVYGRAVR